MAKLRVPRAISRAALMIGIFFTEDLRALPAFAQ
jgi:hypothetical protein